MDFGEEAGQCQGNLFKRPALAQKVAPQPEQDAIAMELVWRTALSTALQGRARAGGLA
jgi:hypothetical protein